MFTVELRKVHPLPFDYLRLVSHLIEPMSNSKLIKDDIQNGGVFEFLFEMCLKCDDPENSKNVEFRVLALGIRSFTRPSQRSLDALSLQV